MSQQDNKQVRRKTPKVVLAARIAPSTKRELKRLAAREKRTASFKAAEILEQWVKSVVNGEAR